ncbi:MAG: aminomethyltransferase beta-barrel domain-containing protein, partial [Actinomycetota bacterium]
GKAGENRRGRAGAEQRHGAAVDALVESLSPLVLRFATPQRRIAPGQSVVCYDLTNSFVLGGGIADPTNPPAK